MSMTELNSTARDLMSVRAMIAELEAEQKYQKSQKWGVKIAFATFAAFAPRV